MKKIVLSALAIALLCLIQSCEKEDDFSCDRNATIKINGEDKCGHAIVQRHLVAGDLDLTEFETFDFNMKYGGSSLLLGVNLYDRIIVEGQVYSVPDTYYGGPGVSGDVVITIVKLDRDNRAISLDFDFTGSFFDHSTSTSHNLRTTGVLTDVNY